MRPLRQVQLLLVGLSIWLTVVYNWFKIFEGPTKHLRSAAGIRLAGATNDVHIFDVRSGKWEKITPQGEPPSPRAAHAAAAVGNMVVIQVRCVSIYSNGLRFI